MRAVRPLRPIRTALSLAALVAAFVMLAALVQSGALRAFDERMVRAARDLADPTRLAGAPWITEVARDATALGGGAFAVFVLVVVAGVLVLVRRRAALVAVVVAVGGGAALSTALKALFDRPRPALVPHLSIVESSSFPSGHAILAAVVYFTLASMLSALVVSRALRLYIAAVAVVLVGAVGVSRVLLGVHYPTDVVAGWLVGAAWALACGAAMSALQRRDLVEEPGETTEDNARQRARAATAASV